MTMTNSTPFFGPTKAKVTFICRLCLVIRIQEPDWPFHRWHTTPKHSMVFDKVFQFMNIEVTSWTPSVIIKWSWFPVKRVSWRVCCNFEMKTNHLLLPKWMSIVKYVKLVIVLGSGKTTQVPQWVSVPTVSQIFDDWFIIYINFFTLLRYIMEECLANQHECRIICTQPRRLAATSIATRISQERNDSLGKSVGYQIRLDSRVSPTTNLILTTR